MQSLASRHAVDQTQRVDTMCIAIAKHTIPAKGIRAATGVGIVDVAPILKIRIRSLRICDANLPKCRAVTCDNKTNLRHNRSNCQHHMACFAYESQQKGPDYTNTRGHICKGQKTYTRSGARITNNERVIAVARWLEN